mgnify:CR=1 FL=1
MGSNWGMFSKGIKGRVGYQCSNYYRVLLKEGAAQDDAYYKDDAGNYHYCRSKSKQDSNASEGSKAAEGSQNSLAGTDDANSMDTDGDESESSSGIGKHDREHQLTMNNFNLTVTGADTEGRTALHYAAYKGNLPLVKKLGKTIAKNRKDKMNRTPLHYAVVRGDTSISVVKHLAKYPDILQQTDNHGMTAAHWAIFLNHELLRRLFISLGSTDVDLPSNDISAEDVPAF